MKQIMKPVLLIFALLILQGCSRPFIPTPTLAPPTQTSAPVPLPTEAPTQSSTVEKTITVYFTDEAMFAVGTEPYEVAVTRPLPTGADPVRAVLDAFFDGPTPEEMAQGLILVASGFTGVREYSLENGIAHIHLEGKCANNGAAYSVASLINKNLSQFSQVTAYKIYDENDDNLDPDSAMSSVPYCLEP